MIGDVGWGGRGRGRGPPKKPRRKPGATGGRGGPEGGEGGKRKSKEKGSERGNAGNRNRDLSHIHRGPRPPLDSGRGLPQGHRMLRVKPEARIIPLDHIPTAFANCDSEPPPSIIELFCKKTASVSYTSGPKSVLGLFIEGSDPEASATPSVAQKSPLRLPTPRSSLVEAGSVEGRVVHGFLTTIFDHFFLGFDRQISTFRDGPKSRPRLTEKVQFLHWIFLDFFGLFWKSNIFSV